MARVIYQVDAFTRKPFLGNPAGVVLDAVGLSDSSMQQIAAELKNSETAFLFPPDADDHDVGIRYFTPATEVPLCGHATIAAHYSRARMLDLPSCTVIQRSPAGRLPVEVIRSQEDGDYHILMTQGSPCFTEPISDRLAEEVFRALSLSPADVRDDCPVQVVSTGHSKLLVGVRRRNRVLQLRPDHAALTRLSSVLNTNGYFVFALEADEEDVLTTSRMFAPAIGVPEDPVTGNGHGPLGAYLVEHRLVPHDGSLLVFRGTQGITMGRQGFARVIVTIEDDRPARVQVGGDAVLVFRAELCV